jgi:predicted RNA-binding Zn ribbon-like protein
MEHLAREHETHAGNVLLRGGRLCLDFVNTVDGRAGDQSRDYLGTYADLAAWGRHVGILGDREAANLLEEAERRPARAAVVLRQAVRLREALYRVFSAVMAAESPAAADLDTFNAALSEAMKRGRILPAGEGFTWDWPPGEPTLDRMLWPVGRSAAELLTSENLERVRDCAGDDCGWLFLDASKNHSRRWCDMGSCGNRAKARRHYQRKRAGRAQGAEAQRPKLARSPNTAT